MADIIKPQQAAGKAYTDTGTSQSGTGQTPYVKPTGPVALGPTVPAATQGGFTPATILRKGAKSNEVTLLQQALNAKGYNLVVDGDFGGATQAAVLAYQKSMGLAADGIAGVNTLTSLGLLGQQQAPAATGTGTGVGLPYHPIDQYTDTGTGKEGTGSPLAHTRPVDTIQPEITGRSPKPGDAAREAQQALQGQTTPPAQTGAATGVTGGVTGAYAGAGGGIAQIGTGGVAPPPVGGVQPPTAPTEVRLPDREAPAWEDFLMPEYIPRDNPYLEVLTSMQFDYNPFEDEDYLRQAAEYEQQVTDMMVGRGGLYSSVTTHALQASLLNLQQNMTKQKFDEFKEERAFMFNLAQFTADENQRDFQNFMAQQEFRFAQYQDQWKRYTWEQEFGFAIDQENWKRHTWEQEFGFAQDQERWRRYTWEAEFEFQRQQAAINNSLARARLNADIADRNARLKAAEAQAKQDAANARYNLFADKVTKNVTEAYDIMYGAGANLIVDEKKAIEMAESWARADLGRASPNVAEYFGVPRGTRFDTPTAIDAISKKGDELNMSKQEVLDYAAVFGREKDLFNELNSWYNTNMNFQTKTHPEGWGY